MRDACTEILYPLSTSPVVEHHMVSVYSLVSQYSITVTSRATGEESCPTTLESV